MSVKAVWAWKTTSSDRAKPKHLLKQQQQQKQKCHMHPHKTKPLAIATWKRRNNWRLDWHRNQQPGQHGQVPLGERPRPRCLWEQPGRKTASPHSPSGAGPRRTWMRTAPGPPVEGLVTYFTFHNQHPSKPQTSQVYQGELHFIKSLRLRSWPTSHHAFEYVFYTSLSLVGNLAHLIWAIKAQQLQEQRCPFLPVRAVFSCVRTMVWLPLLGICTCIQILMQATVPIVTSVCSVFMCPNHGIWLPVFGIFTCAQILMQTIVPVATSACSVFVCPNHGVAASAWNLYLRTDSDASKCTQELYIVMESALEADSG